MVLVLLFCEFIMAAIKISYSLQQSSLALFSCMDCSFTISIMDGEVNILLTSPSCLLICLAISSKPLDKILSLPEAADKVEVKDLSVDFRTIICSSKALITPFVSFLNRQFYRNISRFHYIVYQKIFLIPAVKLNTPFVPILYPE